MATLLTAPGRSRNMAAIRSKDSRPEMAVRRTVHKAGFRFRLHAKDLPGRPDLVFPRYRVAAFVHGCFWHGHQCQIAAPARSNVSYWHPKIAGNVARDRRTSRRLRAAGWSVAVIRECRLERETQRLLRQLNMLRAQDNG